MFPRSFMARLLGENTHTPRETHTHTHRLYVLIICAYRNVPPNFHGTLLGEKIHTHTHRPQTHRLYVLTGMFPRSFMARLLGESMVLPLACVCMYVSERESVCVYIAWSCHWPAYVCMYVSERESVCVYIYIYIYIYIYMMMSLLSRAFSQR